MTFMPLVVFGFPFIFSKKNWNRADGRRDLVAYGGSEDLFVAFSLDSNNSECERKRDDVQNVFEVDVFVMLNVVFGSVMKFDWRSNAFV